MTDIDSKLAAICLHPETYQRNVSIYSRECFELSKNEEGHNTVEIVRHALGLSEWYNIYPMDMAYALITVIGIFGNGLVVLAVLRKKNLQKMRTKRNVLITNLAISNLILGAISYPFLWLPIRANMFPYPAFFCKLANAFPGTNLYCSTLTISAMAMDRFYSVKRQQMSRDGTNGLRTTIGLALSIWIISFCISSPLILLFETNYEPKAWMNLRMWPYDQNITLSYAWQICDMAPHYSSVAKARISIVVNIVQTCFLYLIPLVVLVVFNRRLKNYIIENSMPQLNTRSVRMTDNNNSQLTATTHQQAPPRTNAERRQNRTAKLLTAMALSYALLWLPFTITTGIYDFDLSSRLFLSGEVLKTIDNYAKLISLTSICINPLLYGYLNTNFNREFRSILDGVAQKLCPACLIKHLRHCRRSGGGYGGDSGDRSTRIRIGEEGDEEPDANTTILPTTNHTAYSTTAVSPGTAAVNNASDNSNQLITDKKTNNNNNNTSAIQMNNYNNININQNNQKNSDGLKTNGPSGAGEGGHTEIYKKTAATSVHLRLLENTHQTSSNGFQNDPSSPHDPSPKTTTDNDESSLPPIKTPIVHQMNDPIIAPIVVKYDPIIRPMIFQDDPSEEEATSALINNKNNIIIDHHTQSSLSPAMESKQQQQRQLMRIPPTINNNNKRNDDPRSSLLLLNGDDGVDEAEDLENVEIFL